MGDEAGFSIVTRGFESDTSAETKVPPATEAEQQPVAVASDDQAATHEVIVEASAETSVEPPIDDRVATGDVVVEASHAEEVATATPETPDAEDLEPEEAEEAGAPARPKKLKKKDYEKQLIERHLDWRDLERKVQRDGLKVVVLIEGRDNGRKGGIVNRIADFSDARICRVARVEPPNGRERSQWFFQPYVAHLPAAGEIVLFDGSWYGRAALERATGRSDQKAFVERLSACGDFESMLVQSGLTIIKCWLSAEGAEDLAADLETLGKRWNFDAKDFEPGLDLAALKDQILVESKGAPWQVVHGRDKRTVRVDAIRAIVATVAGAERKEPSSISEGAERSVSAATATEA